MDTSGRRSGLSLLLVLWVAGVGFATYMAITYLLSGLYGRFGLWNSLLGNLHIPGRPAATFGIGVHILAGAVIAILGPLQLVAPLRQRFPKAHRVSGRIYLLAALSACVGGNLFIALNGTVGGPVMSFAFSLFGLLLGLCALQTWRMAALRRDLVRHKEWALRLFVLGIGPLLYRIEYGLWALLMGGLKGHTSSWQGPLDYVMDFFFYIPNLLVCEAYIRWQRRPDARLGWMMPLGAGLGIFLVALGLVLVVPHWWYPIARKVWLQLP